MIYYLLLDNSRNFTTINYRRNLQWKFKFKWNEMVKKKFQ